MYGVDFTDEEETQFEEVWSEHGWRTMPIQDGALQACILLHQAGYELVCVTAMPAKFIEHRLENFRLHGFPIDKIISSGYDKANYNTNPKRKIIEDLHPVAFIDHEYHDDPNQHENIYYDVKYPSLLEFAENFLKTEQHGQDISWPERPSHLIPSS
jgi:hypothetical protein